MTDGGGDLELALSVLAILWCRYCLMEREEMEFCSAFASLRELVVADQGLL